MSGRRQEILDAAVAIADEHGLDAVTMRAVAERVGVTPMALYRHVASKEALLDGLTGHLLGSLGAAAPATGSWDERLARLARGYRELALRHRWAASLLFSRPAVTPDAVRVVDLIYLALLEAGVPDREVPRLERLVSTFVIGFAASEASGRFTSAPADPRAARGTLPDGSVLPGHGRLARWLDCQVDIGAEYEADLADMLTLIRSAASRG